MYIVVQHQISDPAAFWSESNREAIGNLPPGLKVCQTYPNADGTRAVCLWQADSVEAVRKTVESLVGNVSSNEYFEVGAEKAMGLPE